MAGRAEIRLWQGIGQDALGRLSFVGKKISAGMGSWEIMRGGVSGVLAEIREIWGCLSAVSKDVRELMQIS